MLSKRICVLCWEKSKVVDFDNFTSWSDWFDDGNCFCPFYIIRDATYKEKDFASTGVLEPAPDYCPYALEHLLECDSEK